MTSGQTAELDEFAGDGTGITFACRRAIRRVGPPGRPAGPIQSTRKGAPGMMAYGPDLLSLRSGSST
jgi:hypothetical protein